jgi:hypothetical protein
VRIGWSNLKQTDGSGERRSFQDLFSIQPGHVADVHVRNDPELNSQSNGYILHVGSGGTIGYPLLWGEAKTFDRTDPARFVVQDPGGGVKIFFDAEVSGCAMDCPGCREGR